MAAEEKKREAAEKEEKSKRGKRKDDEESKLLRDSDPYDCDNGKKYEYIPMTMEQKRYILGNSMDRPRFTYE